jgi:hypothetical protein
MAASFLSLDALLLMLLATDFVRKVKLALGRASNISIKSMAYQDFSKNYDVQISHLRTFAYFLIESDLATRDFMGAPLENNSAVVFNERPWIILTE